MTELMAKAKSEAMPCQSLALVGEKAVPAIARSRVDSHVESILTEVGSQVRFNAAARTDFLRCRHAATEAGRQ